MTYVVNTAGEAVQNDEPELDPIAILTVVDPKTGESTTDVFNHLVFTDLGNEDLSLDGTETTSGNRFQITITRVHEDLSEGTE
jgi:hypothetical protein